MSVFKVEAIRQYPEESFKIRCVGEELLADEKFIVYTGKDNSFQDCCAVAQYLGSDSIRLQEAVECLPLPPITVDGEAINNANLLRNKLFYWPT